MTTTATKLSLTAKLFDFYRQYLMTHPENTLGKVFLTVTASERCLKNNPHMAPYLMYHPMLNEDGQVMVFNLGPKACSSIVHVEDRIEFFARFDGVEYLNIVHYDDMIGLSDPISPVIYQPKALGAIDAEMNGHWQLCIISQAYMTATSVEEAPPKTKPKLSIVK